jgi:4-hydroxy-3-polyprenylbenzoate decarboxylase
LEQQVSDRLEELGLADLDHAEPDPALFGYVLDKLISIQPRS